MAVLGTTRKAYITLGSTGTPTAWLSGEQNNSFNRTAEAIEVSDKSTEWAQFISGKKGATASFTVWTDDTAGGAQHNLIKALHNGGYVRVFIGKLSGSTPSEGDVFTAVVTSISDTNDNGAVASRSISVTATGAVVHYPALT